MTEDIRRKAIEETREKLKESVERDRLMAKAVNYLDQLNNDIQTEMDRFRDWYSLHFPELESEIKEDQHLVNILSKGLQRDELDAFSQMAEESTGTDLTDEDLEMMEKVLDSIEEKRDLAEDIEEYVRGIAHEEMPNLTKMLGPLLSARLVAQAGGLKELSRQPASTIQMLGAEKALFRYLRGQGTPPKHGLIFNHNFVKKLPEEKRGKMARFIANKSALAARLDYYGDKQKGDEYQKELQDKYEELRGEE